MANQYVFDRLAGIQTILKGVHQAGSSMSAATKGQERAAFIDQFLAQVLPTAYRFGTGDATDLEGNRSGQLDVVVEFPFAPTIPLADAASRLYLAEGVAAVIEVKSDASVQWGEVARTAQSLSKLRRRINVLMSLGIMSVSRTPLFVAAYAGWKSINKVREHLNSTPGVAGVLIIDPGIFVSRREYGDLELEGPWALWGLISSVYHEITKLLAAANEPLLYAMPSEPESDCR